MLLLVERPAPPSPRDKFIGWSQEARKKNIRFESGRALHDQSPDWSLKNVQIISLALS